MTVLRLRFRRMNRRWGNRKFGRQFFFMKNRRWVFRRGPGRWRRRGPILIKSGRFLVTVYFQSTIVRRRSQAVLCFRTRSLVRLSMFHFPVFRMTFINRRSDRGPRRSWRWIKPVR